MKNNNLRVRDRLGTLMGSGYNATMRQDHFSQFEDRIQNLIEGGFARLFSGRLHPRELAIRLAKVMEDGALRGYDDQLIAPDAYCIRLSSQDHAAILGAHPDIGIALADELVDIARIAGVSLILSPQVKILADASVESHQVEIDAWHTTDSVDSTQSMRPGELCGIKDEVSLSATLILNGIQHIPLDRPILNLGRQRDNHIIINDPTVSRHHAQLRLRFRQYVLFDLGSVSGTIVNGCKIQEAVLQSGDVITLGSSKLIYIEDNSSTDIATDRMPPSEE